jgi:hypothetical protein
VPVSGFNGYAEMRRGGLDIVERKATFGIVDSIDLAKPCYRTANVRCIGQRFFALLWKSECTAGKMRSGLARVNVWRFPRGSHNHICRTPVLQECISDVIFAGSSPASGIL